MLEQHPVRLNPHLIHPRKVILQCFSVLFYNPNMLAGTIYNLKVADLQSNFSGDADAPEVAGMLEQHPVRLNPHLIHPAKVVLKCL